MRPQAKAAEFTVRVHTDADGIWAEVLELPGCFAAGETMEELLESLADGVGAYLSGDRTTVTAHLVDPNGQVIEERRQVELCHA
jgi:predicted RNase H-like HicB family nuclease